MITDRSACAFPAMTALLVSLPYGASLRRLVWLLGKNTQELHGVPNHPTPWGRKQQQCNNHRLKPGTVNTSSVGSA
eukprot:12819269-Alexandrium_andersonii.AAC.1